MTVEEKARVYAKKWIVLENRDKFSDEANLRAAEYYAYKAYLAGYNQEVKDLSENKFNPDDYECLAGVCPDLSDEEHCENCSLKRLKRSTEPKEATRWRDPKEELPEYYKKVELKIKRGDSIDYVNACLLAYDDGSLFFGDYNFAIFIRFKDVIGWRPIE